jgi:hypothetical protein
VPPGDEAGLLPRLDAPPVEDPDHESDFIPTPARPDEGR